MDVALKFLKEENPDIFVLQEVNNGHGENLPKNLRSIDILTSAFPKHEYFFAPEILLRYPEGKIDIGNVIFSKFPIQNQHTIFLNAPYGEYDPVPIGNDFSKHPKNLQMCKIDIGGEEMMIGNIHGLWELSGEDTIKRLKMSEQIIQEISNKEHVVLAGDFNVKQETQTIRNIEKYLKNIFKGQLKTSFNLKRKDLKKFPGYASAIVDMIFVSSDVKVLSHKCPDVDVSDHIPLVVELDV